MKKFICAILMAGVLLCGCSNSSSEDIANTITEGANESVESLYATAEALTDEKMVKLEDSYILNYYGIDTSKFSEYVFAQAESPMSAQTIIIARAKDGEDVSGYKENIENVMEQKVGEMVNYNLPDQVKLIEYAEVRVSQKGICVVISPKAETIAPNIQKGLNL